MISSPNNATIRRVRRLRKRADRQKQRAFIVEGHRALAVALSSRSGVELVLHAPRADSRHRQLLIDASDAGARIHEVSERVMTMLSSAAKSPDVLAVAAMPKPVDTGPGPLLVLSGVKDPATVGSLLASAAASGMRRAIAVRGTADLYASTPVRIAAGAHFVLGLSQAASLEESLQSVPGAHVVSVSDSGPPPWSVDLRDPLTIVIGHDERNVDCVSLPRTGSGATASLAVQGAVTMFEARRQREAS